MPEFNLPYQTTNGGLKKMDEFSKWANGYHVPAPRPCNIDMVRAAWQEATKQERERADHLIDKALRKLETWSTTSNQSYVLKAMAILREANRIEKE